MNWNEAEELMMTARDKKKGKPIRNNTRLYFNDLGVGREKYYTIRLHGNLIMLIYRDRVMLSDGGWQTVTTKARLNEYIPRGFYVFQKNWEWFIRDMNTKPNETLVYPFGDVYHIHNERGVMLYSTHPKYPEVYGDDEEEGDDE